MPITIFDTTESWNVSGSAINEEPDVPSSSNITPTPVWLVITIVAAIVIGIVLVAFVCYKLSKSDPNKSQDDK